MLTSVFFVALFESIFLIIFMLVYIKDKESSSMPLYIFGVLVTIFWSLFFNLLH